jgi:hypothetical protein
MERLKRDVILIRLIEALQERGSWCGETHVQKATYFLQAMVGAQMGFEFILYKHGPFSFDLRDELAAMRADGFVSLQVLDPAYGPSIVPEPAAKNLCDRFRTTSKTHERGIAFVTEKFGGKKVNHLERLATAFYVSKEIEPKDDARVRAQRVHELKPHISADEALDAVRTVDDWRREAQVLAAS